MAGAGGTQSDLAVLWRADCRGGRSDALRSRGAAASGLLLRGLGNSNKPGQTGDREKLDIPKTFRRQKSRLVDGLDMENGGGGGKFLLPHT